MNILFLAFTPYHVKLANYVAKKHYKDMNNRIITIDINHTKNEILDEFIDKTLFENVSTYNFNFRMRDLIKNHKDIKRSSNYELERFLTYAKRFNPDLIVFFSDNPVEYQILFNSFDCDKMLVEEGLGLYVESINKDLYTKIKEYIYHRVHMFVYNDKTSRYFLHGQGGYENIICAREPELTKSKAVTKLYIDRNDFKNIFKSDKNKELDIENGMLLSPVQMIDYSNHQIKSMIEEICEYYNNEKIYIKLHPAETKKDIVKQCISKYDGRVEIIEQSGITSEDLILNEKITAIISDYSSTLINATYLRDNIQVISCLGLLQSKYNVKVSFKSSIFRKLIKCGNIKSFKDYSINV